MCGRYSLATTAERLRDFFGLTGPLPHWPGCYNIAPAQGVPVVRLADLETDGNAEDWKGKRELAQLRWGFIPSWAKEAQLGIPMINARAESIADKPAFRDAFRARRCLIPADGFYEWRVTARGKRPYRVGLKGGSAESFRLFAFAGLWERWEKAPDGIPIESCTIITTNANSLLCPIHERMPVILRPEDYAAWLDPATPAKKALALLGPYSADAMTVYPVSLRVNDMRLNDLACVAPFPEADASEADSIGAKQIKLF